VSDKKQQLLLKTLSCSSPKAPNLKFSAQLEVSQTRQITIATEEKEEQPTTMNLPLCLEG